jgi:hypothetical protein
MALRNYKSLVRNWRFFCKYPQCSSQKKERGMTKLIVLGAFVLLATSAWAQPSFAKEDNGVQKVTNMANQFSTGNYPGSSGFHKAVEKWKAPWSGNHPGKHGAPLPLAGGLPALALMGIAVAWAARRRR